MRINLNYIYLLLASILVLSCDSSSSEEHKKAIHIDSTSKISTHSFSNVDQIHTKHLSLELDVNFNNKTLYGIARHEMDNHGSDTAIFDIKALEIQKVTIGRGDERETDFIIGKNDELLGQPLFVKIKTQHIYNDKADLFVKIKKDTKFINIYYKTTEETEALDWLDPKLTAGRKFPFMYSQGEAILTRSWIPIQDVPSNRITYSADVKVPKDLLAVMSAKNPTNLNPEGKYQRASSIILGDRWYT